MVPNTRREIAKAIEQWKLSLPEDEKPLFDSKEEGDQFFEKAERLYNVFRRVGERRTCSISIPERVKQLKKIFRSNPNFYQPIVRAIQDDGYDLPEIDHDHVETHYYETWNSEHASTLEKMEAERIIFQQRARIFAHLIESLKEVREPKLEEYVPFVPEEFHPQLGAYEEYKKLLSSGLRDDELKQKVFHDYARQIARTFNNPETNEKGLSRIISIKGDVRGHPGERIHTMDLDVCDSRYSAHFSDPELSNFVSDKFMGSMMYILSGGAIKSVQDMSSFHMSRRWTDFPSFIEEFEPLLMSPAAELTLYLDIDWPENVPEFLNIDAFYDRDHQPLELFAGTEIAYDPDNHQLIVYLRKRVSSTEHHDGMHTV